MLTVRQLERFEPIERGWQTLYDRALYRTIFQTWEWNAAWWRYLRRDYERLFLLAVYDGELLVGLAPLKLHRRSVRGIFHFNVLSFIGHPQTDYLDMLVDHDRADEVWSALAGWLKRNRHLWSLLELREVAQDSPTQQLLTKAFKSQSFTVEAADDSICPRIVLPQSLDQYLASLSGETRKKTRKNIRRLQQHGKIAFENATPDGIDDFFRLNTSRWQAQGQQGSVPEEKLRAFHRDVSQRLAKQLDLCFLTLDGKQIAVQYIYDWETTRGVYLQGMDMDYDYYSPGITVMINRIENAIACGMQYYDLMRGEEAYKFHYAKDIKRNRQYTVSHSTGVMRCHLLFERLAGLLGR